MISFSVNPEMSNTVLVRVDKEKNLSLSKVGSNYQVIDVTEGKWLISIEVSEFNLSIKSHSVVNIKPFIYEIANVETEEELFELSVTTNERISSCSLNTQQLKVCAGSSYIEFTIQNGVLVLKSDKYLSLNPEQNSLEMMKF